MFKMSLAFKMSQMSQMSRISWMSWTSLMSQMSHDVFLLLLFEYIDCAESTQLMAVGLVSISGYVLMKTGNDTSLPCCLCLSEEMGFGEDYLQVDLTPSMLHTHLYPRLRQHLLRSHGFGVTSKPAENLKNHAKLLLCRRLHSQVLLFDSPPEFLPVSNISLLLGGLFNSRNIFYTMSLIFSH